MQNLKSKNEIQVFCRQKFDLIHRNSICFGTSKRARNSNPSHSREEKKDQDSIPNHFVEDKNATVPNHFVEGKNTQKFIISFWTNLQKIKCSEFHSEPFQKRKNPSEFRSEPLSERKNFWKLVSSHSRTKKHSDDFFAEFRSVPYVLTSEWAITRHTEFSERNTFFRRITKLFWVYTSKFFRIGISMMPFQY